MVRVPAQTDTRAMIGFKGRHAHWRIRRTRVVSATEVTPVSRLRVIGRLSPGEIADVAPNEGRVVQTTPVPRIPDGPTRLLNASEAATLLGIKLSTVRQWTYQRRLPCIRIGGRTVR